MNRPTIPLPSAMSRAGLRAATRRFALPCSATAIRWKCDFARALLRRFPGMNPDHADEIADAAVVGARGEKPDEAARQTYVPGWSEDERRGLRMHAQLGLQG